MLPIKTLLMEMGETFKILIQEKGVECQQGISCLKLQSRWKYEAVYLFFDLTSVFGLALTTFFGLALTAVFG